MYKKQTFAYIHEEKVKADKVKDNYEVANQKALADMEYLSVLQEISL